MCEGDSGLVQVCGGYWVLYKCADEIRFCTSVWRILGSVPVCGGYWVLTNEWRRLGFVQVCGWRRSGSVPVCGGF